MSTTIPVAKQSPRIDTNGTLLWYNGDAFSIEWTVNLQEDGQTFTYLNGDKLIWNFFKSDDKDNIIHSFEFVYGTQQWPSGNTVTLVFSDNVTQKFEIGSYTYCVKFQRGTNRTVTLNAVNKVKVEQCH